MNKNSLLAFVLIALVFVFFNSSLWNNFWYGKVLKKPVPEYQSQPRQRAGGGQSAQPPSPEQEAKAMDALPDDRIAQPQPRLQPQSPETAAGGGVNPDSAAAPRITEDTIMVETDRLIAAISTKGARIISIKVKDYTYARGSRKDELIELIPAKSAGGAQLSVNDESYDGVFFTMADSVGRRIVLDAESPGGRPLRKIFSFEDGSYRIGYAVSGAGVAGQTVSLGWEGGIDDPDAGDDMPFGQAGLDKRRAHYSDGKRVHHFEMKKKGVEEPSGVFRWAAMSSKHFFVAIVAEKASGADIRIEGRNVAPKSSREQDIDYSILYKTEAESDFSDNWIYAGPAKITELSRHGLKFEKTLFPVLSWARYIFWSDVWFPPLSELILRLMLFLYGLCKDYGLAIFFLTFLMKLITFPMTQSSTKSMMRMKDLQPKIMALRDKYKHSPQKMNEEMMALYKAEGVNPFNPGCLPMFLQMPIFLALFIVLRKAIELRGASSWVLPWVKDLSLPEALFTLPFAIPIYGSNVALMPIIMAALTFYQQKAAITDPNQKAIVYIMPVILLVMFNGFPAGVVFYWTLSSAFALVQQKWMKPKIAATATATVTTSSGTHKVPVKKKSGGGKRKHKR
jgi:YidC/Oxa1 family membrane protein insertase